MNYHDIILDDAANGDGIRVTLFVSGCSLHCEGCHNPQCWNQNSGKPFTELVESRIMAELSKGYVSGLTLSGGHPLEEYNLSEVTKLCKKVKELFPTKTIWLYTGLLYENVENYEIIKYIDVLVDGKFEKDKKDPALKWVGSSNQRVINIQETLKQKSVILYQN